MKKNSVPESPITDEEEGEIPATTTEGEGPPRGRRLMVASLGALGVVYGDIGTSPLYALRECFSGGYGVRISEANILGLLSLVFWSLLLIIAIKYLVLVMEADNRGEGGILALMALVRAKGRRSHRAQQVLVTLGLFGSALLYGDAMITPAISVLSAAEGIHVAAPALRGYVVTITVAILTALFFFRSMARPGLVRFSGR